MPKVKTLLIIDDDANFLSAVSRIFQKTHQVTTVNCPFKGLALLRKAEFDYILSDFHMPGMTGEDLYSKLQKEMPKLAARMVFMSGGGPGLTEFMQGIPNPLLSKPFALREARRLIPAS